ncbi:unnamed protein product [Polarella glacialis]|uniref:Uncharacterized protein n=1 Tax=Polarella glacialis TaxID=89957 RepID=A0A813IGS9_POLGL|nr:unnamed protein product [Polarella glacialis]
MAEFEGVPRAIAKLGRRRQWQQAVSLIEELRTRRGDEPSEVAALGAVIGACAKGLQWELALHFLEEQVASSSQSPSSGFGTGTGSSRPCPSVVSFNAAVGACGKARQWERVLQLMADMHRLHISPNSITTSAVLQAVTDTPDSKAWHSVLERLQAMAASSRGPAKNTGNSAQYLSAHGVSLQGDGAIVAKGRSETIGSSSGNGASERVVAHASLQGDGAADLRSSSSSSGPWKLLESEAKGSNEEWAPAISFFQTSASGGASASSASAVHEGRRFEAFPSWALPLALLGQEAEKRRTAGLSPSPSPLKVVVSSSFDRRNGSPPLKDEKAPTSGKQQSESRGTLGEAPAPDGETDAFQLPGVSLFLRPRRGRRRGEERGRRLAGGEREGDEAETETTAEGGRSQAPSLPETPSQPSTSPSPPASGTSSRPLHGAPSPSTSSPSASGAGGMNPEEAALLSALWACEEAGRWQEALALLRSLEAVASLAAATPSLSSETSAEAAAPPFRLSAESYTSVMSACEASGEWALALSLLSDALHAQGGSLVPGTMSDVIMSAFAQGEKWQDALEWISEMRQHGMEINDHIIDSAIVACIAAGRWEEVWALVADRSN